MADNPGIDMGDLTPTQQEALQQYTQVTDQPLEEAIPILARSQWNVQIAISKFFDGEGPDPVAEAMEAQNHPPPVSQRHENLQESFANAPRPNARASRAARPDPAPRIVPQPAVVRQVPWFISIFFTPLSFGFKAAFTFFRTVLYFLSLLPFPSRVAAITGAIQPHKKQAPSRRMLMPRDTAARFKREFEEDYGNNDLPFFEGGQAQALDIAKRDLKFLVMVLIASEHDDTDTFVRETLLAPDVVSFIKDPANNIILWGGSVADSEAYQVSLEYSCTKFPFTAMISLTPKEGSTKMGVIKRVVGPTSPGTYIAELQKAITKYSSDLAGVRAQRAEHEMSRNLRSAQDEAYERSLAADRERARQKREEEAAAAAAERKAKEDADAAARMVEMREQWIGWRAGQVKAEPETSAKDVVRLAIKMPCGQRVVRRFESDAEMEELYAFIECYDTIQEGAYTSSTEPEGYTHEYKFRVASIMPREVYDPHDGASIGEKIGRSANLIVEQVVAHDEE